MGTTSSSRRTVPGAGAAVSVAAPPAPPGPSEAGRSGPGGAAAGSASADRSRSAPSPSRWRRTSSFSRRPPGPVGFTASADRPWSDRRRRAAGVTRGSDPSSFADGAEAAGAAAGGADEPRPGVGAGGAARPPPGPPAAPSAGPAAAIGGAASGRPAAVAAGVGAGGVAAVAAGAGVGEVAPVASRAGFAPAGRAGPGPGSRCPITSPTRALSPARLSIRPITPAAGAGSSRVALSDSRVTSGSPAATASPGCFSHWPISTSVTDSPTAGTLSSTAMARPPGSGPPPRPPGAAPRGPG